MSRFFINRPIVAIVISILTVLVGLVSLANLPVAQYPNIVPPEGRITTTFVGADAQTVEQSVATPIEQQLSGVDNLNYMYSINASDGSLRLTTDFDVATAPDQIGKESLRHGAAADVTGTDKEDVSHAVRGKRGATK